MPRGKPHLLMGDCGSGTSDTRVALNVIRACPALFPYENALPACNRLGVAQDTCLQESRPLARARRKELCLGDLAAKTQRQQQRKIDDLRDSSLQLFVEAIYSWLLVVISCMSKSNISTSCSGCNELDPTIALLNPGCSCCIT